MRRKRELGALYVYTKGGITFLLQRECGESLRNDWSAGKAFYTGTGFYGSLLTMKLAEVVAVLDESAESMAAGRADHDADAREDKADELTT